MLVIKVPVEFCLQLLSFFGFSSSLPCRYGKEKGRKAVGFSEVNGLAAGHLAMSPYLSPVRGFIS